MIERFIDEYHFLSNFFFIDLKIGGKEWPSVEHYYQAMKTLNPHTQNHIRLLPTPGAAKKYGSNLPLREDWEEAKEKIMIRALKIKFKVPELRSKLCKTGGEHLVEGNYWHDNYWGVCKCIECRGRGSNRLGELLMKIRGELC